jgi:hypothetical protein
MPNTGVVRRSDLQVGDEFSYRYKPETGPTFRVTCNTRNRLSLDAIETTVVTAGVVVVAVPVWQGDRLVRVDQVTVPVSPGETVKFYRSLHHYYGEDPYDEIHPMK